VRIVERRGFESRHVHFVRLVLFDISVSSKIALPVFRRPLSIVHGKSDQDLREGDAMLSKERKKKREGLKAEKCGSKKRKIADEESEDD
jgi:hypothetical protein